MNAYAETFFTFNAREVGSFTVHGQHAAPNEPKDSESFTVKAPGVSIAVHEREDDGSAGAEVDKYGFTTPALLKIRLDNGPGSMYVPYFQQSREGDGDWEPEKPDDSASWGVVSTDENREALVPISLSPVKDHRFFVDYHGKSDDTTASFEPSDVKADVEVTEEGLGDQGLGNEGSVTIGGKYEFSLDLLPPDGVPIPEGAVGTIFYRFVQEPLAGETPEPPPFGALSLAPDADPWTGLQTAGFVGTHRIEAYIDADGDGEKSGSDPSDEAEQEIEPATRRPQWPIALSLSAAADKVVQAITASGQNPGDQVDSDGWSDWLRENLNPASNLDEAAQAALTAVAGLGEDSITRYMAERVKNEGVGWFFKDPSQKPTVFISPSTLLGPTTQTGFENIDITIGEVTAGPVSAGDKPTQKLVDYTLTYGVKVGGEVFGTGIAVVFRGDVFDGSQVNAASFWHEGEDG